MNRTIKPLKIGYICSDVDIPLLGQEGCSVKIREFTDALVEAGHDVFILCNWLGEGRGVSLKARVYHVQPSDLNALAWQLLQEEPQVQDNHLERDLKSLLFNYWLQKEGAEIIEREQPDLLYECYALFGYAGIELSRRFSIPTILEVNAPLCQEQAGYEKFPFTRTAEALDAEIFRGADLVIAVSEWMRRFVIDRGADERRVHAIPNGVGEHFCGEISGAAVRERYELVGKRVIGFVGSFHWWHDLDTLLDAFSRLYPRDPELRLLLVGAGPERKKAQETADRLGVAPAVIFTGNVPHEDVPQYIAAMDVAVAPFRAVSHSGLYFSPMKLFEYMAVGRAAVATALGQMVEIIKHGTNGWLCPPENPERLAEGLATLLYTPGLASRIGATAREEVINTLTWPVVSTRILELAEPALKGAGRSNAVGRSTGARAPGRAAGHEASG